MNSFFIINFFIINFKKNMELSNDVDIDDNDNDAIFKLKKLEITEKNKLVFLDHLNDFSNLTILICVKLKLTKLPKLPETLIELDCSQNKLTILPKLPKTLIELNVSLNLLTKLPKLPKKLMQLTCNGNLLTSLPKLPKSLRILSCNYNQLTYLPELPDKLYLLDCFDNKIIELPFLPANLKSININPCYHGKYKSNPCYNLYAKTLVKCIDYDNIRYMKITPIVIQELNTITSNIFKKKANDRMKIIRYDLLEQSARIVMNPKRISRLIESGEISFYDGSMDNLI